MKKSGKFAKRGVATKVMLVILSVMLVAGISIGGTLAWLSASTDPVVNTFTYGDINIELDETTGENYKIVPGVDITKDPTVTVKGGSEDCWLFVKIVENEWCDKVTYELADGWTALPDVDGVYYRIVNASETDQQFTVLKGNKVVVDDDLTKTKIEELAEEATLTFTAYAVQTAEVDDVTAAWSIAKPATT